MVSIYEREEELAELFTAADLARGARYLDDAVDLLQQAADVATEAGNAHALAYALATRADVLAELRRPADARHVVAEARTVAEAIGSSQTLLYLNLILSRVQVHCGDSPDLYAEGFEAMADHRRDTGDLEGLADLLGEYERALDFTEDRSVARREVLDELVEVLGELENEERRAAVVKVRDALARSLTEPDADNEDESQVPQEHRKAWTAAQRLVAEAAETADLAGAYRLSREAAALYAAAGDTSAQMEREYMAAGAAADAETAETHLRAAMAYYKARGHKTYYSDCLIELGKALNAQARYCEAKGLLEEGCHLPRGRKREGYRGRSRTFGDCCLSRCRPGAGCHRRA